MFGGYNPYSYGYRKPTPLYPFNRRPTPLSPRNASPFSQYSSDEEAYLRALARERAQREAAARSAYYGDPYEEVYDPFGGYAYHPRQATGYRATPEELYAAQRQRQFDQQVHEREMMHRHLQEQERLKAQRAEQQRQQQARQTRQSSPQPATKHQPAKASTAPQPPQPTPEQVEAASVIQRHYRAHVTRSRALAALGKISTRLDDIQSAFSLPTILDFDESRESQAEGDSSMSKLLFTSHNAPVHGYEHSLTQLLQDLDAVESGGDKRVRRARKELVGKVELALKELDDAVGAALLRKKQEKEGMSSTLEPDAGWVTVQADDALESELGTMQMESMDVDVAAPVTFNTLDERASEIRAVAAASGNDSFITPAQSGDMSDSLVKDTRDSQEYMEVDSSSAAVERLASADSILQEGTNSALAESAQQSTADTPGLEASAVELRETESNDHDASMRNVDESADLSVETPDGDPADDAVLLEAGSQADEDEVEASLPSVPPVPPSSLNTSTLDTPHVLEEPQTASEPPFDNASMTPRGTDAELLDKVILEKLGGEQQDGVVAF